MSEKLVSTIGVILLNLFSSIIYDKGRVVLEPRLEEQFQETLQLWLEKFFSDHSEPVFDSSGFYNYMEYQKPFHRIVEHIVVPEEFPVLDDQFLKRLSSDCRDSILQAGGKCSIPDECVIYDLFQGALHLFRNYLLKKTTDGETLILYQQKQSDAKAEARHQDANRHMEDISGQLQQLLRCQGKITNPETIKSAYHLLSDAIWAGKLAEVHSSLPLLAEKSVDLEQAIKIKLSVLSDDKFSIEDPLEACSKIEMPILRDDVFRLLILENSTQPEKLAPFVGAITDSTLKKIIVALAANHMEQVIIRSETEERGVTRHAYGIAVGLESEAWLTCRLCIRAILEAPAIGAAEAVLALVGQANFIDQLHIWTLTLNEAILCSAGKVGPTTVFQNIADEMGAREDCYAQVRMDLKARFYQDFLRAMDLAKDDRLPAVLSTVPKQITSLPEIETFRLMQAIRNGSADQDAIIRFVLRTEQGGLLAFYCDSLNDCHRALEIIHQMEYLIGRCFELFDFAVYATCQTEGRGVALSFLKDYETQYATLPEFWVRAYQMSELDTDRQWVADAVIRGIREKTFQYRFFFVQKQMAEILIRENRKIEALDLLYSIEESGLGDIDTARMKLDIYMHIDRYLDALGTIETYYNELKDDEQIIDTFLAISLQYKRPIADEVLTHAKKFKNARILMLAATVEQLRQNFDEAEKLAMQSLLIARPDDDELLGHAFRIIIDNSAGEYTPPSYVAENTYFIAEHQPDHSRQTVCIYRRDVLSSSVYQWRDAQHIDVDSAAAMGFMRLSVGDTVDIRGKQYTIIEIGPLAGFYFRACIDSLEQQNQVWKIRASDPEEFKQNIVKLFQEYPHWNQQNKLQHYTDFSQIACPIYQLRSGASLEYGQLMRLIMEDPSIPVREYVIPLAENVKEYVITYTALVGLHQLGIDLQNLCGKIIVPKSVAIEAQDEADTILQRNSKDVVASLGVQGEQVQIFQPPEEAIRKVIQDAAAFKRYTASLPTVENTKDAMLPELRGSSLPELIGICDYDALVLAHTRGAVLVTCEMITAGLTQLRTVRSRAIGLADFLCKIGLEITALLDALKRMLQYRFCAVITPTVIQHMIEAYNTAGDVEKRTIEQAWKDVLEVPSSLDDDNYLRIFISTCIETIQILHTAGLFSQHPIIAIFNWAVFCYSGGRVELGIKEGKLYYRIVHTNLKQVTEDPNLSEDEGSGCS